MCVHTHTHTHSVSPTDYFENPLTGKQGIDELVNQSFTLPGSTISLKWGKNRKEEDPGGQEVEEVRRRKEGKVKLCVSVSAEDRRCGRDWSSL